MVAAFIGSIMRNENRRCHTAISPCATLGVELAYTFSLIVELALERPALLAPMYHCRNGKYRGLRR
jgi:hypothetical protein